MAAQQVAPRTFFGMTLLPQRKGHTVARGAKGAVPHHKIRTAEVTSLLRNIATLLQNGVSLPKALGTMAEERGLENCRDVLHHIRQQIENGGTFSGALAAHRESFDELMINQVRVGERAGTLGDTLADVALQREKAGKLRSEVLKKLAYPVLLAVVGCLVITFLLTYVVPVFEETYRSANVPLPFITQLLIQVGAYAKSYGIFIALAIGGGVFGLTRARRKPKFAGWMDAKLMSLPAIGGFFRDVALLEMMEILGNLMESGYTLVDALNYAADGVSNRAMRIGVRDLQAAVERGERFSRVVEQRRDLFPPMVSQLIIIGEQTGRLVKTTRYVRDHLQEVIQRKSNAFVAVIEPTLTISLAGAVAVVLLAIYLPMFDMINAVGH